MGIQVYFTSGDSLLCSCTSGFIQHIPSHKLKFPAMCREDESQRFRCLSQNTPWLRIIPCFGPPRNAQLLFNSLSAYQDRLLTLFIHFYKHPSRAFCAPSLVLFKDTQKQITWFFHSRTSWASAQINCRQCDVFLDPCQHRTLQIPRGR